MRGLIPGPQPGGGGGSAPAARTMIIRGVTGNPAVGSTNNRVPIYNAQGFNNGGADFTFTVSATLGSYFTIVTSGIYYALGNTITAGPNGGFALRVGETVSNTADVASSNLLEYPLGFAGIDTSQYPHISGYFPATAGQLVHVVSTGALWTSNTAYNAACKFMLYGPF
jgi:hypothetical protein